MSDKSKADITKPLAWLIAIHVIGVLGLMIHDTQDIFIRLIPVNFLVTIVLLFLYQKHWNIRIIAFCFFVFVATFFLEAIGVQTGKVFGSITFGRVLGPKAFNVPIIMGFIWLILVYCTGIMIKNLKYHVFIKAAIAAGMLLMLDVIIEPVAMKFGMWGWANRRVPLLNYVSWFVISYGLTLMLFNLKAKLRNELAPFAFCVITGFFLVLNLL